MISVGRTTPGLLLLCLVAGCSLPGPSQTQAPRTYLLQDDRPADGRPATLSRSCLTLRIGKPNGSPGFMSSRMAYREKPGRIDYFVYHRWADTPASMLRAMMESRLDEAGMFAGVVSGSPDVRTRLRLDSELQRLIQDFTGNTARLDLSIKVSLVDVASHALLGSKTFSYGEAAGADPEAGVLAANRAAQRFLTDLETFLTNAAGSVDCSAIMTGGGDQMTRRGNPRPATRQRRLRASSLPAMFRASYAR